MSSNLNPEKALIFRIVHIRNVPKILEHGGLFARTAPEQDPNYVNIGNSELIGKRASRPVPIPPGGMLNDYVAFYFTPFSMMMLNIKTGHNGITKRPNKDIVIFVSSIHRLEEQRLTYVFTNGHAYMAEAEFYRSTDSLDQIDWPLLQRRDFKSDPNDFSKQFRYQAEALVHRHLPLASLVGIVCYNGSARDSLTEMVNKWQLNLEIKTLPQFYF